MVDQTILDSTLSEHIIQSESDQDEVSHEVPSDSMFKESINSDD